MTLEDPCSMSHICHGGRLFGDPIGALACKKKADGYFGRKHESFEASVWMEASVAGAQPHKGGKAICDLCIGDLVWDARTVSLETRMTADQQCKRSL